MKQASLSYKIIIVLLITTLTGTALSGVATGGEAAPIQATATVVHPVGMEEFPPETDYSQPALLFRAPGSTGTYIEIEADGVCMNCPVRSKPMTLSPDAIAETDGLSLISFDDLAGSVPSGTRECTITVFVTEN